MLVWAVDAIAGFDTAWVTLDAERLTAEGHQSGLIPHPYWLQYRLETAPGFVTTRMTVVSRWNDGAASLVLARDSAGHWNIDGEPRPDLEGALDVDLAGCPLTNTLPILRHGLQHGSGDREFRMAFIDVPSLRVELALQRYTHVRKLANGKALVRFRSGSFSSDLTIDADGCVVDYPSLGRRLEPPPAPPNARS